MCGLIGGFGEPSDAAVGAVLGDPKRFYGAEFNRAYG